MKHLEKFLFGSLVMELLMLIAFGYLFFNIIENIDLRVDNVCKTRMDRALCQFIYGESK